MSDTRPLHVRRDRFEPAADLGRLRAETPLTKFEVHGATRSGSAWLATGYDQVREVLGDATRFSTRRAFAGADGPRSAELVGNLMDYDPPEHTRLRKMLTREFTVRRMRRLEPRIEAIVTGRLDAMDQAGPPADLVRMFARPIPSMVLCELIGVPRDDRADFERRSHTQLDLTASLDKRAAAGTALTRYLAALVTRQRRDPGEDMLGMLVREHGAELTDEELAGICVLLLLAGLDNVSGMLGLGALLLLENPDQLGYLRAHPDDIDRAVEELLRFLSPPHAPTPRIAVTDLSIDGQTIRAGERVVCSIPSANRDQGLVDEPDRLDLGREPAAHVAFGHGIHHCLGAPLARMELRIGYLALVQRFPELRLAIPAQDVRFRRHSAAYGVESLPVTW